MPAGFLTCTTHSAPCCLCAACYGLCCLTNPITLGRCMFRPGSVKVTAGCFSSCGLWPVWLRLNTLLPLHIARQCFAKQRLSGPKAAG